nr:MAG TPA: hypothetical protein [Caudoviricetes sp.]
MKDFLMTVLLLQTKENNYSQNLEKGTGSYCV